MQYIRLELIILQVLDARDPLGTRSKQIEHFLKKEKPHKHLLFLLNKCDLVPTWATVRCCHHAMLCIFCVCIFCVYIHVCVCSLLFLLILRASGLAYCLLNTLPWHFMQAHYIPLVKEH